MKDLIVNTGNSSDIPIKYKYIGGGCYAEVVYCKPHLSAEWLELAKLLIILFFQCLLLVSVLAK